MDEAESLPSLLSKLGRLLAKILRNLDDGAMLIVFGLLVLFLSFTPQVGAAAVLYGGSRSFLKLKNMLKTKEEEEEGS